MKGGWLHRARGVHRKTLLLLLGGASDYIDGPVMPPEEEPERRRRRWLGYAVDPFGGSTRRRRRRRRRTSAATLTTDVGRTLARSISHRAAEGAWTWSAHAVRHVATHLAVHRRVVTLATGSTSFHVARHVQYVVSRATARWTGTGDWMVCSPYDDVDVLMLLAQQEAIQ